SSIQAKDLRARAVDMNASTQALSLWWRQRTANKPERLTIAGATEPAAASWHARLKPTPIWHGLASMVYSVLVMDNPATATANLTEAIDNAIDMGTPDDPKHAASRPRIQYGHLYCPGGQYSGGPQQIHRSRHYRQFSHAQRRRALGGRKSGV